MVKKPAWSIKCQKKMVERGLSKKKLAQEIGVNYTELVNVMNGIRISEAITQKIIDYLKEGE